MSSRVDQILGSIGTASNASPSASRVDRILQGIGEQTQEPDVPVVSTVTKAKNFINTAGPLAKKYVYDTLAEKVPGAIVGGLAGLTGTMLAPGMVAAGQLRGKSYKQSVADAYSSIKELTQRGYTVGSQAPAVPAQFPLDVTKRIYEDVSGTKIKNNQISFSPKFALERLRKVDDLRVQISGGTPATDEELLSAAKQHGSGGAILSTIGVDLMDLFLIRGVGKDIYNASLGKSYKFSGKTEYARDSSGRLAPTTPGSTGKPIWERQQTINVDQLLSGEKVKNPNLIIKATPTEGGGYIGELYQNLRPWQKVSAPEYSPFENVPAERRPVAVPPERIPGAPELRQIAAPVERAPVAPEVAPAAPRFTPENLLSYVPRQDAPDTFYVFRRGQGFLPIAGKQANIVPGVDTFVAPNTVGGTSVYEAKSGIEIAQGKNKNEATAQALNVLHGNYQKIQQTILGELNKNGISPRYTNEPQAPVQKVKVGQETVHVPEGISPAEYKSIVQQFPNDKAMQDRIVQEAIRQSQEQAQVAPTPGRAALTPGTQRAQVAQVVAQGPKTAQDVAQETGILEPNIRRILGTGTKEGTFERVSKGVYTLKSKGKNIAVVQIADALESLPALAEGGMKADAFLLDIPYQTGAVEGGNRGEKYDKITPQQFSVALDSIDKMLVSDNSPIVFMYSTAPSGRKEMEQYLNQFPVHGYKPIARGFYKKMSKSGGMVTNVRGVEAAPEGIIILSKSGKADKIIRNEDIQYVAVRPAQRKLSTTHTTAAGNVVPDKTQAEKPEAMLRSLIELTTPEDGMVIDPFAGTGSSAVAAVQTGRRSLSIEKNPTLVEEVIKPRVEAAAKTLENIGMPPEMALEHASRDEILRQYREKNPDAGLADFETWLSKQDDITPGDKILLTSLFESRVPAKTVADTREQLATVKPKGKPVEKTGLQQRLSQLGWTKARQNMEQKSAMETSFDLFESRLHLKAGDREAITKEFGSIRGLYDWFRKGIPVEPKKAKVSPIRTSIATVEEQYVKSLEGAVPMDLSSFVRKHGGFSIEKETSLKGELRMLSPKESGTTGLIAKGGKTVDGMLELIKESGQFPEIETADDLLNSLTPMYSIRLEANTAIKNGKWNAKKIAAWERFYAQIIGPLDKLVIFNPNAIRGGKGALGVTQPAGMGRIAISIFERAHGAGDNVLLTSYHEAGHLLHAIIREQYPDVAKQLHKDYLTEKDAWSKTKTIAELQALEKAAPLYRSGDSIPDKLLSQLPVGSRKFITEEEYVAETVREGAQKRFGTGEQKTFLKKLQDLLRKILDAVRVVVNSVTGKPQPTVDQIFSLAKQGKFQPKFEGPGWQHAALLKDLTSQSAEVPPKDLYIGKMDESLFSSDVADETAALSNLTPELLSKITVRKVDGKYEVVSGKGVVSAINMRKAKGLEVPEKLDVTVLNDEPNVPLTKEEMKKLDDNDAFASFVSDVDGSMNEKAADIARLAKENPSKIVGWIRRITGATRNAVSLSPSVRMQDAFDSPHNRVDELFPDVYAPVDGKGDLGRMNMTYDLRLQKRLLREKFKLTAEEDKIVQAYRALNMDKDTESVDGLAPDVKEKFLKNEKRFKEYNRELTKFTDHLRQVAIDNGISLGYHKNYVPGIMPNQKADLGMEFTPPNEKRVWFADPKKSNLYDTTTTMDEKFDRYIELLSYKINLEPKLNEAVVKAGQVYENDGARLRYAMKWISMLRSQNVKVSSERSTINAHIEIQNSVINNPESTDAEIFRAKVAKRSLIEMEKMFSSGEPIDEKQWNKLAMNVSTVYTQAVASSKLGAIFTTTKNILYGTTMTIKKHGLRAWIRAHTNYLTDFKATTEAHRKEAPHILQGALPMIYGTFGAPTTTRITKGFLRFQKMTPGAWFQMISELYLRNIAFETAKIDGKVKGFTGGRLMQFSHVGVVRSQQIYLPVDMPQAFRGSGGRALGQFAMPSIKQANEVLYSLKKGQWLELARFFGYGFLLFLIGNFLIPGKKRVTADGKEYTERSISPFEGIDPLDLRRAIIAYQAGLGPFGMLGMMAEKILAPATKLMIHFTGVRTPSDQIYNKYLSTTELVLKDLSLLPQEMTLKDIGFTPSLQRHDINSTKDINTAIGAKKLLEDNQNDPKKVAEIKERYAKDLAKYSIAKAADAQINSAQAHRDALVKAARANKTLDKAEKNKRIKDARREFVEKRKEIISTFYEKSDSISPDVVSQAEKKSGGNIFAALLGIHAANAATVTESGPVKPVGKITPEEKKAMSTPNAKSPLFTKSGTDEVARSIANIEGYNKPGSLAQRQNNPGNLVYAGQPGATRAKGNKFAKFPTPYLGWIALKKQIISDAKKGMSLQSFVYKYAPPHENSTQQYLQSVARRNKTSPRASLLSIINQ